MTEPLPEFPYHPDPIATGSVVSSDVACACCGRVRGYIYTGAVYAVADLHDQLCPWCIADGSAAERYDVCFVEGSLGDDVSAETFSAVDRRTPSFASWQATQWFFHCGDGAMYLGPAGAAELAPFPDALAMLRYELSEWEWPADQVEHYLSSLDKNGQPTAYLFRCRVCAAHLAYSDFT